ncbi:MAG: F0F1 ATP synthase subunit [Tistrella sp.]|jgi:ATP synthase protein I|uniref:F0F1-ATPase subunit n=2 Tax=Tistrella mobilis TaxID=171437 RepID=I3TL52_TISMK|nr:MULTISPECIES: AtpZ/AtpI family protein [Tistrella]AFK53490.1 F0F1-ATPase subunit [Tistrella mobilis KA081020-065]MAD36753.1 F0F1 ATP synthase subunit [Tistrella sp.]MBA75861.1 F0F1 ATP synthase subunit [Tistrella sp.]HAE46207.1 F0F1 ATP synthase subunit [Tistrella mobilis]
MTPPRDRRQDRRMEQAADRQAAREAAKRKDHEPGIGHRLGQIGVLGWMIVTPMLLGLFLGRWFDRLAGTGITFAAALLMAGVALGFWSAWKWMHRP